MLGEDDPSGIEGQGILQTLAHRVTVLSAAYAVLAVLPLFLVGSQSVVLQRDLGFGRAQLGLATSACYAASALTAVPLGRLIQRAGPAQGLRLSGALSFTSLLIIGLVVSSWWQLVLALALCGCANAAAQVSSNLALAGGVARSRQALAFGAKQAAVPFSSLLAGVSVPAVSALVGWRGDMLAAALIVALVLVLAPPLRAGAVPGEQHGGGVDRFLVALAVSGLCAGAIGNTLPAFMVDSATAEGFGHNAASVLLALGGAAAIAGRVGTGWLADRRRSVGVAEMMGVTLLGAAAFVALVLGHASRPVFVLSTLVAFGGGWGWAGIVYFATVRTHPVAAATASSFVLSWVYVGNVVGPAGVGRSPRSPPTPWRGPSPRSCS